MTLDLAVAIQAILTSLAGICAIGVAMICLARWRRASGYKSAVYMGFALVSVAVALLNLSVLVSSSQTMAWPVAFAYVGFATALFVPAARALGSLR